MEAEYMDDMDLDEDFDSGDEPESPKNRNILRLILLVLFVLMLVVLVGILLYNILFGDGNGDVGQATATPTSSPTSDGVDVIITPEEPTVTPTRVLEEPTPEPTDTPEPEPTEEPSPTPTQVASPDEFDPKPIVAPGIEIDLLENGDFEEFTNGVGTGWSAFHNDSVIAVFSPEGPGGPYVKSGDYAQRITMAEATQPDRYAGIYQQVEVVPGQVYSLTLNGQIRTGFADINLSSYGYRMQYAIDHTGGDTWQDIPADAWVELPWDEQQLHSPDVEFLSYTTAISSTSDAVTLFVRVWNKWANPGEVQYTLDSLSLMGASRAGSTDDQMIDKPLPVTGENDTTGFVGTAPFWGALIVLALLAVGAVYKAKWSY
jgi:hypothetical protein